MNPLVTVNILSYNRKDELRNTLQKVYEQSYKNIEVIVVDNASTDGSPQMVKKEFPGVILIELDKNIGISGWNKGFEIAKGEYVLVLDDDAYPDKGSISQIVLEFTRNRSIGAITLKVFNVYKDTNKKELFPGGWVPDTNQRIEDFYLILGCAFAIRRSLYVNDLFSYKNFICFHELPIVLNVTNQNYSILFSPQILAYHKVPVEKPPPNYTRQYFHFRNMTNFIYYFFPTPLNFFYSIRISFIYLIKAIKNHWLSKYFDGLISLTSPLVTFTQLRLQKKYSDKILKSGIIDYKLFARHIKEKVPSNT